MLIKRLWSVRLHVVLSNIMLIIVNNSLLFVSFIFFINIDRFAQNNTNGYFLLKFIGMALLNGTGASPVSIKAFYRISMPLLNWSILSCYRKIIKNVNQCLPICLYNNIIIQWIWSFINVASVPLAYRGGFSQLLEASPISHGTNDSLLQGELSFCQE